MKKLLAVLIGAAACSVAVAQTTNYWVPVPVAFALTANIQTPAATVGGVRTFSAPSKYAVVSKTISDRVWAAEWYLGNVGSKSNIIGAQLVLMTKPDSMEQSYFAFYFANSVICDVSDVLAWDLTSGGVATAGRGNVSNNTMTGEKYVAPVKITFDDRSAGGDLWFEVYGLSNWLGNDTVSQLNYVEKLSVKSALSGGGDMAGQNLFISGKMAGAGSALVWF